MRQIRSDHLNLVLSIGSLICLSLGYIMQFTPHLLHYFDECFMNENLLRIP